MQQPATSRLDSHHLATFKSRGVAVPFTSPLLAGSRVREAGAGGIELILPNPAGRRGIYVLDWPGIRSLCNPTAYDTILFRRLGALTEVAPFNVRDAALEIAINGPAGRDAAAAANDAIGRDSTERLRAHFQLSIRLVEKSDPSSTPGAPLPTADIDRRAKTALNRIAPSLGWPATKLAPALFAIGDLFAPLGVAADDQDARIPRLLSRLQEARDDLAAWLGADPDHDTSGLGRGILGAMTMACKSGQAVLRTIRIGAADPVSLLKRWIKNSNGVLTIVTRCGWLLDGWERVSLLWLAARTTAERRAALLEMAPIVPVLPREVIEWTNMPVDPAAMEQSWRVTSQQDSWRTGSAAFALVERNEKILAMTI